MSASSRNETTESARPGEGWAWPTHVTRELGVLVEPGGRLAQSVQSVVSQIQHRHRDIGVRSFCFIGDRSQSGVTVIAANVAVAFAMSGQRVALLEANFEKPRLTSMFGLDANFRGLSDSIIDMGAAGWAGYLQPVYPNLLVMTAGRATKEGEAFLATRMRALVLELSRMFDVIICDAAPMDSIAAALSIVSAVERTIVVARANRTHVRTLAKFEESVKQCGGTLGGTVYLDF